MLGMMALLKSEIRPNLYYNKYKYRGTIVDQNIRFICSCKTFAQFLNFIKNEEKYPNHCYQQRLRILPNTDAQLDEVKNIIEYRNKMQLIEGVVIRREHNSISFYSNNIELLKEIWEFRPNSFITEANAMPTGVMTFVKEPQHKYRLYLVNGRVNASSREELAAYVNRSAIFPCHALSRWLKRNRLVHYVYEYSNNKFFLEYDDPGTLTVLGLICPELIGKVYKLEKR